MKKQIFKLRFLPVIAFTALIFLIVRAHSYTINIDNIPNIPISSTTELWDVLCYAKSTAVLFITIWAILTMIYLLIIGRIKIKKTYIYIPMAIYTLGVIVSYIMSDYKEIALYGSTGRFEGTRTILCYMFMLFYTINVVDDIKDAIIITIVTTIGVFIACVIGFTQLIGQDFYLTDFGNYLITGDPDLVATAKFWPGQVYQSVANMNYVGMYLTLIIPVLIYALYYFNKKSNNLKLTSLGMDVIKRRYVSIFIIGLLLLIALNVYGADSTGGVFSICICIAVLLIIMCDKKSHKIIVTALMAVGIILFLILVYVDGKDTHTQIDYFETGTDCVKMSVDGNELNVIYNRDSKSYALTDGNGNPVPIFWFAGDEGNIQVDDPRFAGKIVIVPITDINGNPCVVIDGKDNSFGFTFYEDGAKYLNPYGEEISLHKVDSIGFKDHLASGSGRGYIWSRTVPLLKGKWFVGSGADTFMFLFPQDDYAGKYSIGSPLNVTGDKPHNMYLGMAVCTGIMSMVAFLAMVIIAMWKVFHLGNDKTFVKVMAAGIIGFLVAGIFNDSTVCIMPMFYGMLGSVIALSN